MSTLKKDPFAFSSKPNPFREKRNTCTSTLFLNYGEQHLTVFQSLTKLPFMKRQREDSKMDTHILNKTMSAYFKRSFGVEKQDLQSQSFGRKKKYFKEANSPQYSPKMVFNPFYQRGQQNFIDEYIKTKRQNHLGHSLSQNSFNTTFQPQRINQQQQIRHQFSRLKSKLKDPKQNTSEPVCASFSLIKLYKQKKIGQRVDQSSTSYQSPVLEQKTSTMCFKPTQNRPPLGKKIKLKAQLNKK